MDAINNLASAATKAIWGDTAANKDDAAAPKLPSAQEPISGVQGDPAKGEPFDAGNAQENSVPVKDGQSSQENPSAAHASSHGHGDSTKDQIDTREPGNKHAAPAEADKKKDVDNVEPLDPKSVKGPGPKPLEQVAKEHGGDAGNAQHDEKASPVTGGEPANSTPDAAQPKDGKKPQSEGTGEKLVKSTGLVADGGDFDASNPGAGREADRLLEEKGIHHETTPPANKVSSADPSLSSPTTAESSSPERKGVRGLGHKIKAKLRRSSNA